MSFGKRLKAAREKAGKTQSDVAALFSVSRETVAQWESDLTYPTADKLSRLASALKTSADFLLSGKVHRVAQGSPDYNVSAGPDITRMVPLISWVRAGLFEEAVDNLMPGDAEAWYPMPRKGGPRTYALRVVGDSMTSPYGKSYPAGCIIFVDPDLRSPASGQRIIAKLEGGAEATFKQLVVEAERTFLKPLNPQYPAIFDPFKVIGTVVGKWEDD